MSSFFTSPTEEWDEVGVESLETDIEYIVRTAQEAGGLIAESDELLFDKVLGFTKVDSKKKKVKKEVVKEEFEKSKIDLKIQQIEQLQFKNRIFNIELEELKVLIEQTAGEVRRLLSAKWERFLQEVEQFLYELRRSNGWRNRSPFHVTHFCKKLDSITYWFSLMLKQAREYIKQKVIVSNYKKKEIIFDVDLEMIDNRKNMIKATQIGESKISYADITELYMPDTTGIFALVKNDSVQIDNILQNIETIPKPKATHVDRYFIDKDERTKKQEKMRFNKDFSIKAISDELPLGSQIRSLMVRKEILCKKLEDEKIRFEKLQKFRVSKGLRPHNRLFEEVYINEPYNLLTNWYGNVRSKVTFKELRKLESRAKVFLFRPVKHDPVYTGLPDKQGKEHEWFSAPPIPIIMDFLPYAGLRHSGGVVNSPESFEYLMAGLRNKNKRGYLQSLVDSYYQAQKSKNYHEMERIRLSFYAASTGFSEKYLPQALCQGPVQSVPVVKKNNLKVNFGDIPVNVSVNSEDISDNIVDIVKVTTVKLFGEKAAAFILKFFFTLVAISTTKSVLNLTSILGMAISDYLPYKEIWNLLKSFNNSLSEVISVNQVPGDFSDMVFSSAVMQSLWRVLSLFSVSSAIVSTGLFGLIDPMYVSKKLSWFLKDRATLDDVIAAAIRLFNIVCQSLVRAIRSGNWRDFFYGNSCSDWLEESRCILEETCLLIDDSRPISHQTFLRKVKEGLLPPRFLSQITEKQRLLICDELYSTGQKLLESNRKILDNNQVFIMQRTIDKLLGLSYDLSSRDLNGSYRMEPFAFYLYGRPGSGKSSLSKVMCQGLSACRSLPTNDSSIYHILTGMNFWDGFNSQHVVVFDDVDHVVGTVSANMMMYPALVTGMLNAKPFMMEQADVSNKGKKYANFLYGLYVSNFMNANLNPSNCAEPLAFWRRFQFKIKAVVKEKYATAGVLQASKLDGSNNYHIFIVREFDASLYDFQNPYASDPYQPPFVIESTNKLSQFLCKHFRIKCERFAVEAKKHLELAGARCPLCFLLLADHKDSIKCVEDAAIVQMNFRNIFKDCSERVNVKISQRFKLTTDVIKAFRERESIFSAAKCLKIGVQIAPYLAGLMGVSVAIGALYRLLKHKKEENQGFIMGSNPTLINRDMTNWSRVDDVRTSSAYVKPFLTTSSEEEVVNIARSGMINIKYGEYIACALVLKAGLVCCPAHYFLESMCDSQMNRRHIFSEESHLFFSVEFFRGKTERYPFRVIFGKNAIKVKDRDLVIMDVPQIFAKHDLTKHIPFSSQRMIYFAVDRVDLVDVEDIRTTTKSKYVTAPNWDPHGLSILTYSIHTKSGDCSKPILVKVGRNYFIGGFHIVATLDPEGTHVDFANQFCAFGEEILGVDIKACEAVFDGIRKFSLPEVVITANQFSKKRQDVILNPLPAKSSLAASLEYGPVPFTILGSVFPSLPLSKMKSKVKNSVVKELFDDVYLKYIGEPFDFEAPDLRGKMVEGKWLDPHIVAINAMENKNFDPVFVDKAVSDYLEGVENLSGREHYRVLSDYEAIVGLEGDLINPMKMQTSTGLPYNTPKENMMYVNREEGSVYIHPSIQKDIDEIYSTLRQGKIFAPACAHTLKDEPVRRKKNSECNVRVFNTFPVAYNFISAKYLAPIEAFIQHHPIHFENAVGVNVLSSRWMSIIKWLKEFDLTDDGDHNKYDLHANTQIRFAETCVWTGLASFLKYSDEEINFVRLLILGTIFTIRFIKNDLIIITFTNPSGFQGTIFVNCIINSLINRIAYFMGGNDRPFRTMVHAMFLGDDNLRSQHLSVKNFTPKHIADFLRELGFKYTSADKSEVGLKMKVLEECTFAKRHFRKDGLVYKMALEKKSIFKMIMIRTVSELSEMDHVAVLCGNVLRESYLHGESFFNEINFIISKIIDFYKLEGNPNLKVKTYHECDVEFMEGNYNTWSLSSSLISTKHS